MFLRHLTPLFLLTIGDFKASQLACTMVRRESEKHVNNNPMELDARGMGLAYKLLELMR